MNLSEIGNHELFTRLENLSRTERKITHLILWHILEVETRKLFADRGFSSCFEYLTQGLGYSEGSANRRLQSARLLRQVPQIGEKIEAGSLNLSQLSQVQRCIRLQNKSGETITTEKAQQILSEVENKNTFETQKVLALEFNFPIQAVEKIKPQKNNSIKLEIIFTEEQMKELELAKSMLSHACPDGTWSEVISHLVKSHNKKPKSTARNYMPVQIRRELFDKANRICEYVDPLTHRKCSSKYQLQIDHLVPVSKGGSNQAANLRILCRAHNIHMAKVWDVTKTR